MAAILSWPQCVNGSMSRVGAMSFKISSQCQTPLSEDYRKLTPNKDWKPEVWHQIILTKITDTLMHLQWTLGYLGVRLLIDQSHKSHGAPVQHPTTYNSKQKCACFCSGWCIMGYGTGALWYYWDWSIITIMQRSYLKMHSKKTNSMSHNVCCSNTKYEVGMHIFTRQPSK